MKTIKLPAPLTIALGQYYLARAAGKTTIELVGYKGDKKIEQLKTGPKWDKNKSLEIIEAALPKKWGFEACAGTFWIYNPKTKTRHYKMSETTWPVAEVIKNKKKD